MNSACGWTAIKLGDLVEGHRGVSYQPHDLLSHYSQDTVILLRANNIQNGRLVFNDVQIVPTTIVKEQQLLSLGDLAVCMSNGSKSLVGKSAQYDGNLSGNVTVGAFCSIFRTKEGADSDYIKQIFHSDIYQAHIDYSLAGSAINNLKNFDIESLELTVPPKVVQQKIARILQTIDRAIEQTEALIDKYQQIKAGLMHDLFTRGIGPDGQLRPPREQAPHRYQQTPIGWIPKEWDVKPCLDICSRICVGIVIQPTQYYVESGVPAFRSANVRESGIDPSNMVYISPASNQLLSKSQVKAGDIVSVRTGYPGTSAVVPDEFEGSNCIDILISTPTKEIIPEFLCSWINSSFGKGQVLRQQGGMAQQHFNVGEMRQLLVVIPTISEQKRISNNLSSCSKKILSEENILKKLIKQKSGLMHDLLTGKVSVTPDSEPVHG